MSESLRDREKCAKCGYTLAGHVGNTGCLYPCWTPSGTYAPPEVEPPADSAPDSAGEPETETVKPGEEFDALTESMIGALRLDEDDAADARNYPLINLPELANAMTNRLTALQREHAEWDTPELLAQRFHEAYERLAPSFGYETRKASAKPWADVPDQNKRLMIAVCAELIAARARAARAET